MVEEDYVGGCVGIGINASDAFRAYASRDCIVGRGFHEMPKIRYLDE